MLRAAALRTGLWSILLQVSRIGTQTLVFLVFTRHLSLEEIGAYSFAFAFIQATQALVRSGVLEIVISRPAEPSFLRSALAASLIFGAAVSAFILAAGVTCIELGMGVAGYYLLALCAIPLIDSFCMLPEAMLRRELRFDRLALRTFMALTIAAALSLGTGALGFGGWALVLFNVSSSVLSTAIAWKMAPALPAARGKLPEALEIIRSAVHISSSTFATGLIFPLSQIALGILSGPAAVGAYSIAQRIVSLVNALVMEPMRQTALPILSKISGNEKRQAAALEATALCATILSPLYLGIAGIAPLLMPLVIGENGHASATVLQILCWHFVPLTISLISGQILLVCGKTRSVMVISLSQALTGIVFGWLAAPWGATAVALAYVLRAYALSPVALRQAKVHAGIPVTQFLKAIAAPLAAAIGMLAVLHWLNPELTALGLNGWESLPIMVMSGAASYIFLLFILARDRLVIGVNTVRSIMLRSAA